MKSGVKQRRSHPVDNHLLLTILSATGFTIHTRNLDDKLKVKFKKKKAILEHIVDNLILLPQDPPVIINRRSQKI